jgi:4-hydroxy-tetrahydrodipicolinate reductase
VKLALLGHGNMGRVVADRARTTGHEIGLIVTAPDAPADERALAEKLRGHDAAIDFTAASAVLRHATACAAAGVPLIEGTTGWGDREGEVRRAVEQGGGALVYGANFSLGVQLFYRLVAYAGELFRGLSEYDAFIEEAHHARKRDAPSGTALRLRDLLASAGGKPISIASTRAGHIPGTHRVGFDSAADQIVLEHSARSREGFASGALLAAHWIVGKKGVFAFEDILDEVISRVRKG